MIKILVTKFWIFQILYISIIAAIQLLPQEYLLIRVSMFVVILLFGLYITNINQTPTKLLYYYEGVDLIKLYKSLNQRDKIMLDKASYFLCKEDARCLLEVGKPEYGIVDLQSLFWIKIQIYDLYKYKDTLLEIRTPELVKITRGENWPTNTGMAMYTELGAKVVKELSK